MKDNVVIIGITPLTELIFNEEFPELKKISIKPYNITYSKFLPLSLKLLIDAPRILSVIWREHQQLKTIINDYGVNVVISDNRFGLYNKSVESIYITHQLNIKAGLFSGLANTIHHSFIKQFNEVWIPDIENREESLAGELSYTKTLFYGRYIGAQSRLKRPLDIKQEFDYLFLISGPEPTRTSFEKDLLHLAEQYSNKKVAVVRGSKQPAQINFPKNCSFFNMPTALELSGLILSSRTIICRSGYSTLMDLYALNHQDVILVPTPGQKEQEYLADYWQANKSARYVKQKDLKRLKL